MSEPVHCVWIGNPVLSLLELLSIKQYQRLNFEVQLWTYEPIKNLPAGAVARDANEILPEASIFRFHRPGKYGHGSPSHWSDIFQLMLLYKYGGWYSQLDVTCLRPPTTEYYFAHHYRTPRNQTINTYAMRVPPQDPFLQDCLKTLRQHVNAATLSTLDWLDSMKIIGQHVFKHNLKQHISWNNVECGKDLFAKPDKRPEENIEFIHWCNSGFESKDAPQPGSFYAELLASHDLLPQPK